MEKEEDVKVGANRFSERQPLGTAAQSDIRDYKEAPPAPLFEPGELKSWSFYRAGIAEFVATFLFLYITILTVMGVNRSTSKCSSVGIQGIAWSFGGMIFALVYCTAGISGGHINPAVTFGLFLARKLSLTRAIFYIVMQCLGAICGAGVVKGFEGNARYELFKGGANFVNPGYTKGDGLGAEIVGTFVLVYTVFSATDAKRNFRGNAVDLPDTDPLVQRYVEGFQPEQISLSLSTSHSSVWISWITGEFQIGDNIEPLDPETVGSIVQYGRFGRSINRQAVGYSLVYSQLYPFEGLQNYTSGIIHHVRLTGLRANTLYQYQCGDPSLSAMSDVHYFRTMPVSGPKNYPSRIAVVGDLGLTYNTTSTVNHMTSNHPDLILLVGDASYANMYLTNGTGSDCYSCSFSNTPIHETYQPRWDYWGRYMQPLISSVPIMVIEGNHEIESQAENKTFVAYSSRFAFPSDESGSSSTLYYSFNAGGIHFIMLGSYVSYDKSGDQYKWLEKDLASLDREVTPWLVATWHAPWYSTYKAHYREAECMRVEMEDLLYKYGVDIVFNGHIHAYERSNRVYNYTLDPCGPVHITVGDGGNREKMAITHADEPGNCPEPSTTPDNFMGGFCAFNFTSGPAAGKFCWDQQPDYSAFRESSFGHGILEVKNETHALWIWHRNQDYYGNTGDEIYIVRQPDKCPSVKPERVHKT